MGQGLLPGPCDGRCADKRPRLFAATTRGAGRPTVGAGHLPVRASTPHIFVSAAKPRATGHRGRPRRCGFAVRGLAQEGTVRLLAPPQPRRATAHRLCLVRGAVPPPGRCCGRPPTLSLSLFPPARPCRCRGRQRCGCGCFLGLIAVSSAAVPWCWRACGNAAEANRPTPPPTHPFS